MNVSFIRHQATQYVVGFIALKGTESVGRVPIAVPSQHDRAVLYTFTLREVDTKYRTHRHRELSANESDGGGVSNSFKNLSFF